MIARSVRVCVIVSLVACSGLAQSTGAPATAEHTPEPRVVEMTFTPAPVPVPALKYLLLPGYIDQEAGSTETIYRTASQLCDQLQYSAESEKLFEQVRDWVDMPLDALPRAQVDQTLKQASVAMRYARIGSRRQWCQWDIPAWKEGFFDVMLPELAPLRTLGRLLAIRARIAIAENRYPDAIDDLQTLSSMAHCLGEAPTLLHALVGAAEVKLLAREVEHWIAQPGSPNLYWALTDLPRPLVDQLKGTTLERWWLYFDFPDLRRLDTEVMSPEQIQALYDRIQVMLSSSTHDDSAETAAEGKTHWDEAVAKNHKQTRKLLLTNGYDPVFVKAICPEQAVMLQMFDDYRKLRDDLFKLFGLPYSRAHAGLGEVEQRIEEMVRSLKQEYGSALFADVLPALTRARFLMARADRDITILRVVEAIRLYAAGHDGHLPPSLDTISEVFVPDDPMTGKPFVYECADGVATLIGRAPKDDLDSEVHFQLKVQH